MNAEQRVSGQCKNHAPLICRKQGKCPGQEPCVAQIIREPETGARQLDVAA